jgi:hypothetical protein
MNDINNNGVNDKQERLVEMGLSIIGTITGVIGVISGLVIKDVEIIKWSVLLILGCLAGYQSTSITKYIKELM